MTEQVKTDAEGNVPDVLTDLTVVKFSGHSDDIVYVAGDLKGCDEHYAETDDEIVHATFVVAGLRVRVEYDGLGDGTWTIHVGQISEDVPVAARGVALSFDRYSAVLEMLVPKGSYVTREGGS